MKNKPEITERELVNSMDARVWAKEFMRLYENSRKAPQNIPDWVDEDLMRGWFANAIMAGYDNATRKLQAENKALKEQLDKVKGITVGVIANTIADNSSLRAYPARMAGKSTICYLAQAIHNLYNPKTEKEG
uniref:Uncharacterized protein n=3 Tax=viral metagenome TaxID=1070528 RepID=A0A6M3J041_9ZZZZ